MNKYFQQIKELIEILKKENLSEISIEDKGFKICIKKENIQYVNTPIPQQKLIEEKNNFHRITSPLVGIVRLNKDDGNTYIKLNEQIKNGQIICIIEAMKVLNEITSDVSGKLIKILVKDKQLVEYGQTMFLMEKDV